MEYMKLLIPFIVGIFTTPVVEGIKSAILFQKKEKLVMTEIADLLEDVSGNIDKVVFFLINVVGDANPNVTISAEQLFSPIDVDIVFLRDNLEDFYIRSPKNSRAAIKKIFKGVEELKELQKAVVENKQQSLKNMRKNESLKLWVLYYEYLSCLCDLKGNIEEFSCNEEIVVIGCNESVKRECDKRDQEYSYLYDNFEHAKQQINERFESGKRLTERLERRKRPPE